MRRAGYVGAAAFFVIWIGGLVVDLFLETGRHWWDLRFGRVGLVAWGACAAVACVLLMADAVREREIGRLIVVAMVTALVALAIVFVAVNGIRV